ncbi:hypothetical protein [Paenibacillus flagellatus]|uniref:hypothetical protein n=1 Tax=Paenibacillus flagellatus TaxID=2211139 RepID=UPI001305331A|nr:hypothetical protein [Paenibacillus flagellatus]
MNHTGMSELTNDLEQMISKAGVTGLLQSFNKMSKEELIQFVEALGTVRRYMLARANG